MRGSECLFSDSDRSVVFGRNEGVMGYAIIAERHPDWPIAEIAERGIRIAMVASGRFDVDPESATGAVLEQVTSDRSA